MDAQSGRAAAIAVQAPPEQDAHLVIDEAHQRSKAFGVCSDDAPDFSSLAISQLKAVLEENRFLFQHAVPVMETRSSAVGSPSARDGVTTVRQANGISARAGRPARGRE